MSLRWLLWSLLSVLYLVGTKANDLREISWAEGMYPEVFEYVMKTRLYETNGFISLNEEDGYQSIHEYESFSINFSISCYFDSDNRLTVPKEGDEVSRQFQGLLDYAAILRLYFLTGVTIINHMDDFPTGAFPRDYIQSLDSEVQTWRLINDRMQELQEIAVTDDSERQCTQIYENLAKKVLELLLSIASKGELVCNEIFKIRQEDLLKLTENYKDVIFTLLLNDHYPNSFNTSSLSTEDRQEIDQQLILTLLFTIYIEKNLLPFLLSSEFCWEYEPKNILYIEDVIINLQESDKYNLLSSGILTNITNITTTIQEEYEVNIITQKCKPFILENEEKVKDIRKSLLYQQKSLDFLHNDLINQTIEQCERALYLDYTNHTNIEEIKNVSHLGGSMTFQPFYCKPVIRTTNHNNLTNNTTQASPTDCVVSVGLSTEYTRISSSVIVFSPSPIYLKPPRESLMKPTGRMLLVGLGGGAMNKFFMTHFPSFEYDQIELRESIVKIALQYYQFDSFVCNIYQLQKKENLLLAEINAMTNTGDFSSSTSTAASFAMLNKLSLLNGTDHINDMKECHSNVIISDIVDYLVYLNTLITTSKYLEYYLTIIKQTETEKEYLELIMNHRDNKGVISQMFSYPFATNDETVMDKMLQLDIYYDYIMLDIFDGMPMLWNGDLFHGISNSNRYSRNNFFVLIKYLLRPFTGLAAFHIHKDQSFKMNLQYIIAAFGRNQVFIIEISTNDAIVVAARDRYRERDTDDVDREEKSSTDEIYRQHPLYRAAFHPCDNTYSHIYEGRKIVEQFDLPAHIWLLSEYSLNCNGINRYLG